jgi:murein DD-endopeptidase MepM/ murein hydrolase activator NlpD
MALCVPAQARTGALQISRGPGAVYPGDVTLVTVSSGIPVAGLEGTAFNRPVHFWRADRPDVWHGLVAVALDTPPGSYELTVRAPGAPAAGASGSLVLHVQTKHFETRRLRVSARFVDPPASEAQRIAQEQRRLSDLFHDVNGERLWRGAFVVPVPGRATSSFGRLSVLNGQPRSRHQGADFAAAAGTPVVAPNAGRVVLAEDLYFSGNTVVIDHGLGMFSLLAHLSHIDVTAGRDVARGEMLGLSGATGRVTGPHLHWALRLSEFSVDPLAVVAVLSDLKEN